MWWLYFWRSGPFCVYCQVYVWYIYSFCNIYLLTPFIYSGITRISCFIHDIDNLYHLCLSLLPRDHYIYWSLQDLTLIYWAPFKLLLLLFSISFIHALIFIWSFLFFCVYYVLFYVFCSGVKTGPLPICFHWDVLLTFPLVHDTRVRVVVLDFSFSNIST